MKTQLCPICNSETSVPSLRYPKMVCKDCLINYKIVDENGVEVAFYNSDILGGLEGRFVAANEIYNSTLCFINGIKCEVEEGRFGGVIFQIV